MNYKRIKGISKLLILLIILLSIVGCESNTIVTDNSKDVDTKDQSIVIIDHLGREVKFDKPAERIVSGYYITTAMLLSLGLKDNVVGIEAKANTRPIYNIAAPELLELPSIGTMKEFDLEGALALEPDLVIVSVRLKDAVESMEKLGVNVLAVNPENMDLLNEALIMVAKATGREENANKLIDYNNKKTTMIMDLVKGKEKKDVYLGGNSSFLSTASNKMYQHALIETVGGHNVAGNIDDTYWADISYEQLIAYNPDIIVAIPGASYSKADIMNDVRLKGIKAFENDDVYFMPSNFENWDSPLPSGVLGTLWLAAVLHDDVYSFDNFKEDAYNYYKEFYGIEINKDNITK